MQYKKKKKFLEITVSFMQEKYLQIIQFSSLSFF